jgi:hypothetical protein
MLPNLTVMHSYIKRPKQILFQYSVNQYKLSHIFLLTVTVNWRPWFLTEHESSKRYS